MGSFCCVRIQLAALRCAFRHLTTHYPSSLSNVVAAVLLSMFGPKPYTGTRHEDTTHDDDNLKNHVQPTTEKAAETEEPHDS